MVMVHDLIPILHPEFCTPGGAVKYRIIVNRGSVIDTDDLSLVNNANIKLGVTFEAMEVNDTTALATWLMNVAASPASPASGAARNNACDSQTEAQRAW